jgi:glutamyl-Q tRNA(Asp) synthetase
MYVGRFAPSPTGPLHMGSLVTAVASYCEARTHHGKWFVRMEDVDATRAVVGADTIILGQLRAFGFKWDGEVIYQTSRTEAYQQAFEILEKQNLVYPCTCTRKEIVDSAQTLGLEGLIYPKTCLKQAIKANATPAYRIKTTNLTITVEDETYGNLQQNIAKAIGDFILKRADNYFAYQLAVVVDDEAQGITHIVRGADLLESTPRQRYLQQNLGFSSQHYMHIPIVFNHNGEKLSKHTQASPLALDASHQTLIVKQLYEALVFLGQAPPSFLLHRKVSELWSWAFAHWQKSAIKAPKHIAQTHQ